MSTLHSEAETDDGLTDAIEMLSDETVAASDDDIARPPIDGSVASLLEQAQEENASLQDELLSLRRDVDALEERNAALVETIESMREELADTTAKEQSLSVLFGRLADLQVWTASSGRDTVLILAPDMVEAARTAAATGTVPDRVVLVQKPIIWPDYLIKP